MYYSATLDGLYQAAQNMAKNHLCGQSQNDQKKNQQQQQQQAAQREEDGTNTVTSVSSAGSGGGNATSSGNNAAASAEQHRCRLIPEPARQKLISLRDCKKRAAGGKKYWAEGARVLGVRQDVDGLRFIRISTPPPATTSAPTPGTVPSSSARPSQVQAMSPENSSNSINHGTTNGTIPQEKLMKKIKKQKLMTNLSLTTKEEEVDDVDDHDDDDDDDEEGEIVQETPKNTSTSTSSHSASPIKDSSSSTALPSSEKLSVIENEEASTKDDE